MVTELSAESFDAAVSSERLTLVDFWAGWCGPCRMLAPVLEELAEEFGEKVNFCKTDIDAEPELAAKHSIASVPTVLFFKNGEVVKRIVGVHSADDYADAIEENS